MTFTKQKNGDMKRIFKNTRKIILTSEDYEPIQKVKQGRHTGRPKDRCKK